MDGQNQFYSSLIGNMIKLIASVTWSGTHFQIVGNLLPNALRIPATAPRFLLFPVSAYRVHRI